MKERIKLAVFDVDGTFTERPTLCELMAKQLGRLSRMQFLELHALDKPRVTSAREEMAQWFLEADQTTLLQAIDGSNLKPGAIRGVELLKENGIEVALCSLSWEMAVEKIAELLGIEKFSGTTLAANGEIGHAWAATKAAQSKQWANQMGISMNEVSAIGDTNGDREMLRQSGLPIYLGNGRPEWLPEHAICRPDTHLEFVITEIIDHGK